VHCDLEKEFQIAVEHAARDRLAQLVNIELERLGIYASHVQIYPSPERGWTATVMTNPARVVEYQAFADGIAANLRQHYALKDRPSNDLGNQRRFPPTAGRNGENRSGASSSLGASMRRLIDQLSFSARATLVILVAVITIVLLLR
jgi:hypothetical protein